MSKNNLYVNQFDAKLHKKIKKREEKTVRKTAFSTTYVIEEFKSVDNKTYYAIFNDCWPDNDAEFVNPDPQGRAILKSYGNHMARLLILYKEIIDTVFNVTTTTYSIHCNHDIIVYNDHYRIRFTKTIESIPVQYRTIQ